MKYLIFISFEVNYFALVKHFMRQCTFKILGMKTKYCFHFLSISFDFTLFYQKSDLENILLYFGIIFHFFFFFPNSDCQNILIHLEIIHTLCLVILHIPFLQFRFEENFTENHSSYMNKWYLIFYPLMLASKYVKLSCVSLLGAATQPF